MPSAAFWPICVIMAAAMPICGSRRRLRISDSDPRSTSSHGTCEWLRKNESSRRRRWRSIRGWFGNQKRLARCHAPCDTFIELDPATKRGDSTVVPPTSRQLLKQPAVRGRLIMRECHRARQSRFEQGRGPSAAKHFMQRRAASPLSMSHQKPSRHQLYHKWLQVTRPFQVGAHLAC